MPAQSTRTEKFKLRFSLRTFLVVVTVSAFPMAWLGKQYLACQREKQIAHKLTNKGVSFTVTAKSDNYFDRQLMRQFTLPAYKIDVAAGLDELDSLLNQIAKLKHVRHLHYKPETDLQHLKNMSELRVLELTGWSMESLDGVENCQKLEKIYLYDADGIKTLEPLRGMTNLKQIHQTLEDSSKLTIAPDLVATWTSLIQFELLACKKLSLEGFRNLEHLEVLEIQHADEIDGVDSIKDMKSLRRISLPKCHGLQNLDGFSEMQNLEDLVLYECHNLENIEGIKDMPNLKNLWLANCDQVQDWTPLKQMKSLQKVTLLRDNDFPDQLKDLRAALPNTTVNMQRVGRVL